MSFSSKSPFLLCLTASLIVMGSFYKMDQAFVPGKTSKLVIRVKVDNSSAALSGSDPLESETEYNPMALMVVAGLVLMIAALVYYYFNSSTETVVPPEFAVENPTLKVTESINIEPVSKSVGRVKQGDVPLNAPITELSSNNQSITTSTEPEIDIPEGKITTPSEIAVKNINANSNVDNDVNNDVNNNVKQEDRIISESSEVERIVERMVERMVERIVEASSESEPMTDFSVNVKRAQFTHGIEEREPIDLVDAIVPAKSEGLVKIYFFSELMNVKGQEIRHQWIHEGKLESELTFNVRGNRWRVNSSKRLNPAAIGNWQVNVVNETGDILISKQFEYKLL